MATTILHRFFGNTVYTIFAVYLGRLEAYRQRKRQTNGLHHFSQFLIRSRTRTRLYVVRCNYKKKFFSASSITVSARVNDDC